MINANVCHSVHSLKKKKKKRKKKKEYCEKICPQVLREFKVEQAGTLGLRQIRQFILLSITLG